MKFAKKIEIKLTVKDNQFLKEQVPYLQRCCDFSTFIEKSSWLTEQADLEALIDSDEFIITLEPVTHRNGELTVVDGEFQYTVQLTFQGTSMFGGFHRSYEPYVLLPPSEIFLFIFPNVEFNTKRSSSYPISPDVDDYITTKSSSFYPISLDVDDYINPILSMVFGLKNEGKFKYEII